MSNMNKMFRLVTAYREKVEQWIRDWSGKQTIKIVDRYRSWYELDGEDIILTMRERYLPKFFQQFDLKADVYYQLGLPTPVHRRDGLFSDLTLKVGSRSFPVHRLILGTISPYFYTLFDWDKSSVIELKEVDPEIFEMMLDLIYHRPIPSVRRLDTIRLVHMAQQFQIDIPDRDLLLNLVDAVSPEQILPFINLLDQLSPAPWKAIDRLVFCFEKEVMIELFPQLPLSLQEYFEESYGPLDQVIWGEDLPYF